MKCKRRKAIFGIDDAIIAALISGVATAGTGIYNSYQNKKRLQEQQRATNMANIDEQNLALQQNLGTLANNRDYIDDRQNQIVLKTRNDNQLAFGGDTDKEREKIDWNIVRDYVSLLPGKIKRKVREYNDSSYKPLPTPSEVENTPKAIKEFVTGEKYESGPYKGEYKNRFLRSVYKKRKRN